MRLRAKRLRPFSGTIEYLSESFGLCQEDFYLCYDGMPLSRFETPASVELEPDAEITMHKVQMQIGGKPVIYLIPPADIAAARVSLRLVPQWHFSTTYPVVAADKLSDGGQQVVWDVEARKGGELLDKKTGTTLSYLFWEAEAPAGMPPSPPASDIDAASTTPASNETIPFNPSSPSVEPSNSILLPIASLPAYLDRVLASLTLHTSARNDFMTYWLPRFLEHAHVALRFLPQESYEPSARLAVESEPKPDVITRIFMLFRGVAQDDVADWQAAAANVESVQWAEVVGVKPEAWMEDKYRVLEWGGMEVVV